MDLTSFRARWWTTRCWPSAAETGKEAGGVGQLCRGAFGGSGGRFLLLAGELVALGTFLSSDSWYRAKIAHQLSGYSLLPIRPLDVPYSVYLEFYGQI